MRLTDTDLIAFARLQATPEWRAVEPYLRHEHAKALDVLVNSADVPQIYRAQGAANALLEVLNGVANASEVLRKKRGG